MINQEQKHKPVWRVPNYDGCVPSDLGSFVLVDKDTISSELFLRGAQWYKLDFILDVLAYETTRTRAAKYEGVKCEECLGKGYKPSINLVDEFKKNVFTKLGFFVSTREKCPHCNGKGYTLEKINAAN